MRMDKTRRKDLHVCNLKELKINLRYIYHHYIESGSVYAVNISHGTKLALREKYISLLEDGDDVMITKGNFNTKEYKVVTVESQSQARSKSIFSSESTSISSSNKLLIKEYVVMYDRAMEQTIGLIKTDSLSRFYHSAAYRKMIRSQDMD